MVPVLFFVDIPSVIILDQTSRIGIFLDGSLLADCCVFVSVVIASGEGDGPGACVNGDAIARVPETSPKQRYRAIGRIG